MDLLRTIAVPQSVNQREMESAMAVGTKSLPSPKKKKMVPSEAIRDGVGNLGRVADNERLVPKTGKIKTTKRKVAVRMPARSEAVSGDEADLRTLTSRQDRPK